MKKFKKTISLILLSVALHPAFSLSDIFENISQLIRSSDSRQISNYFGNNVDLTIINAEEVYSKAQAEQILKDFFTKNPPKSFSIIHRGVSKEGSKYAIGNYITINGNSYRTYVYVKTVGGAEQIQEMRFEKE